MSRMNTVLSAAILVSILLSLAGPGRADPPDIVPLCDPYPIPTDPTGASLQFELSNNGENFALDVWRFPCDEDDSYVIFTVRPGEGTAPRICSADLLLSQEGRKSSVHFLTEDPLRESVAFCGDVTETTSFALFPSFGPWYAVDPQQAFDVLWNLSADDLRFTMFAYDPGDYDDDDFPPDPGLINDAGLNGMFFDPANPGHGLEISVNEVGLIIYYFGQTVNGEMLWLISDLHSEDIQYGQPVDLTMFRVEGTFGQPELPAIEWGTLSIEFSDCDNASALMEGDDGSLPLTVTRLVGLEGMDCS